MNVLMDVEHYGTKRHSGRYPWGSGKDSEQRRASFIHEVDELRKKGLSNTEIAKGFDMSTTDFRAINAIAKEQQKAATTSQIWRMSEKGMSNVAIGERLNIGESLVRKYKKVSEDIQKQSINETASIVKSAVDSKKYIDIGAGVENHMGISRRKLNDAVLQLENEGYKVQYVQTKQLGTGKYTSIKVLTKDDVSYSEVNKNKADIKLITDYSTDRGHTYLGLEPPKNISSKSVFVNYAETGGRDKDGVIELRRGVPEISLGNASYAQVRIAVDGTHYLKGMAVYADDIPKGYNIRFNTNKKSSTAKLDTFKEMKKKDDGSIDTDNPFGALIKDAPELQMAQRYYTDSKGNKHLSALNIVNEEGDWGSWSKTISSQVLSKQQPQLAKKQLDLYYDFKKAEYDEIMGLTNPAVKEKLLQTFSDNCDSAAVNLKAAALPRQNTQVILPFPTMKETECYAPNYNNGDKLALIRYPHGGIFEIAEVTVNNKFKPAIDVLGTSPKDAIGIHPKIADKLSGADFDGDFVLTIPNNNNAIKSSPSLTALKNFDTKDAYPSYKGMPRMTNKQKQAEMGSGSNLITDMTIKGASMDELARAVKYSMVVIDAEKHYLNYRQCYDDMGIAALKAKYQGSARSGASTLVSRSSSEQRVNERKAVTYKDIDPKTGKITYKETGNTYKDVKKQTNADGSISYVETGVVKNRQQTSTKMFEVDDARLLSSGTQIEEVYATHANKLKALANDARKEMISQPQVKYSSSANKTYKTEVDALNSKLKIAQSNAPKERQAQLFANSIVKMKREANINMDAETLKKIKGQALTEARKRVGAKKESIDITQNEWNAIQAGAISPSKLKSILNNTDIDLVKKFATPRPDNSLSTAMSARVRQLINNGYTQAEIAEHLNISVNAVRKEVA